MDKLVEILKYLFIVFMIFAIVIFTMQGLDGLSHTETPINLSCPVYEPEVVKCDLSAINFSCVFDKTIQNYWENVFPSKQCAGIKLKDMEIVEDYSYATGSMRPYIYKGDTIYVVPYDQDKELVLGDIVSNGKTLHRIVAINSQKQTYKTKGDNKEKIDRITNNFNDTKYVVCGVLRGTE